MTITDWIQAVSTAILVAVTIVYAWRTHVISKATEKQAEASRQQAEASVKMAEEMRKQRLDMYRPAVSLSVRPAIGEYLVITVRATNEGRGLASNPVLYVSHPLFSFVEPRSIAPISSKEASLENSFRATEPSDENDPRVTNEPIVVVANYEDIFGNPWHSTLELTWDAKAKNLRPGRMDVGRSGHHDRGVKEK